jgi:hypothetical protein
VQANLDTAPERRRREAHAVSEGAASGWSSASAFIGRSSRQRRYSDVDIDGRGAVLRQRAAGNESAGIDLRLVRPPDTRGWRDSYSAALEGTDIEDW